MTNIDKEGLIIIAVSILLTTLIIVCIKFSNFNCNKIKFYKTINYETI
jgi:hypothetical protein